MAVANIREVAQRARVSVGTVSNVLNRPDMVAPATRQRVLDAIDELGFVRNEAARHLRAGHSRTVGFVVLDVANPYFTDVARGVEARADEHDAMVTLCNSNDDPVREQRHVQQLEEQRVLGILITPVQNDNPYLEHVADRGTPVVLVDRGAGRNQCSVAVDDVLGGRLAGTHLLEQGHRRLGFIGGPLSVRQVYDRNAGLHAAIADLDGSSGTIADVTVISRLALTVEEGRLAATELLKVPSASRPTAVFCANDLLALGLLQEVTRRGVSIPGDLAIVGYDDIGFAAAATVPLSSVRQPREQLGQAAVELLLDELEHKGRHTHRQVVFQPDLIVRDSSHSGR
jgi:LacI family transcriptional regulator